MKQVVCEICGSTDLIKENGLFVCQSCGIKYSLEEAKKLMVGGTIKIDKTDDVQNLLKRAFMHLEEGKFEGADELLEKVLNQDVENVQAYIGKMMIKLGAKTEKEIDELPILIDEDTTYKRIMQFGDSELKQRFEQYAKKENPIGSINDIVYSGDQFKNNQETVIIHKNIKRIDFCFTSAESIKNVFIMDGVTVIPGRAFFGCSSLTNIVIPDSVTSIGDKAFLDCSSLTSVKLPDSVTSIGNYAFQNCSSLTSIVIPDSVTSIGWCAFSNCSITSIVIPDSFTSIGDSAFSGCDSLASVVIPDSVTSIGGVAFASCFSLKRINFAGTKAQWKAITKGYDWDVMTGNYTIYCTDGTIAKDGTVTYN